MLGASHLLPLLSNKIFNRSEHCLKISLLIAVRLSARQASRYYARPYTARKRAGHEKLCMDSSHAAEGTHERKNIRVNVLDCRRTGAEQNLTDHIVPEQVGLLRSPLDFISMHPLCWDCKCKFRFECLGNYLLLFYETLSRRPRPGVEVQGGMKPFPVVEVHIALDVSTELRQGFALFDSEVFVLQSIPSD